MDTQSIQEIDNMFDSVIIDDEDTSDLITEYPLSQENKQGQCEDCLRYSEKLITEDACADGGCCEKDVCYDGCIFICNKCNKEFEPMNGLQGYNPDLKKKVLHCSECYDDDTSYTDSVYGAIQWYGISVSEYERRYG